MSTAVAFSGSLPAPTTSTGRPGPASHHPVTLGVAASGGSKSRRLLPRPTPPLPAFSSMLLPRGCCRGHKDTAADRAAPRSLPPPSSASASRRLPVPPIAAAPRLPPPPQAVDATHLIRRTTTPSPAPVTALRASGSTPERDRVREKIGVWGSREGMESVEINSGEGGTEGRRSGVGDRDGSGENQVRGREIRGSGRRGMGKGLQFFMSRAPPRKTKWGTCPT